MNKLISITRGDMKCEHCARRIRVLCTVEVDGARKTVGSSCVAKFVPELNHALAIKMRTFNAAERRTRKQTLYTERLTKRRAEFQALIEGAPVVGENLVRIIEPELLHGLASLLLDDGFTVTDDETIFSAPSPEAQEAALDSYEGLAPVRAVDPRNADAVSFIENYRGNFSFVISLREQLKQKGFLSEKQVAAVVNMLEKQRPQSAPIILTDAVITVNRWFARYAIVEQTGIKGAHYNFEVLKIFRETEKAFQLELVGTGKPTTHCSRCGAHLTNDESIKRGIGPICAEKMGVVDSEGANKVLAEVTRIFTVWVPKKVIKACVNFPYAPQQTKEVENENDRYN